METAKALKSNESMENYLETIFVLSLDGSRVRSIDIVNELELSKPSVSIAMRNLREKSFIEMDSEGYITLTDKGQKLADAVYEKHVVISGWLMHLGVDKLTALQDACKMEHSLSEKSFSAIKSHIQETSIKLSP